MYKPDIGIILNWIVYMDGLILFIRFINKDDKQSFNPSKFFLIFFGILKRLYYLLMKTAKIISIRSICGSSFKFVAFLKGHPGINVTFSN